MRVVTGLIAAAIFTAAGAISWMTLKQNNDPRMQPTIDLPVEGSMPQLENVTAWLNTKELKDADLRGKVVLINFWTYSCINWRRQLPYVRAWSEKYKDKGLIVIGVHTPEFAFEKNVENVRSAVKEMRIDYPVALDNEYSIWSDFDNRYWPALYFVDARGQIRHHKFGEGNYEESERVIQRLLKEAGSVGVNESMVSVDPLGAEAAAAWSELGSPEIYAGYDRIKNFASPGGPQRGKDRDYQIPSDLQLNQWALGGTWDIGNQATTLWKSPGSIKLRFHARDLHLVMGPGTAGIPIRFRVLIDGKPPGDSHGTDVDGQGGGNIVEPRMYQLVRQPGPISDRTFEIEFLDPGVEIFSFTFG